ncbi:hypothetical protein BSY238_1074 [Methyloversatilis sp. RAC08]|nr:hypothetical protein BSY238_1074 [Methyloversatilis sp. RAC08]
MKKYQTKFKLKVVKWSCPHPVDGLWFENQAV